MLLTARAIYAGHVQLVNQIQSLVRLLGSRRLRPSSLSFASAIFVPVTPFSPSPFVFRVQHPPGLVGH